MSIFDYFKRKRRSRESLQEVMASLTEEVLERGPFPKCGGCGKDYFSDFETAVDKKGNHGYLCAACMSRYADLLKPDSIRNFWMCGACGYRILAGTEIDAVVDEEGNACPNCTSNVNITLVNLKNDRPIASGFIGEPLE